MAHLPKNTLAYLNASPYCKAVATDKLPFRYLGETTKAYLENDLSKRIPDKEAVEFYALNHLVSVLKQKFTPNEILPDWAAEIVAKYLTIMGEQGPRLVHYVTCIIARESRHNENVSTSNIFGKANTKFGHNFTVLYKSLKNSGESEAVTKITSYIAPLPNIGQYAEGIKFLFNEGEWGNSYGGKPWGTIAEALEQLAKGVMSMEAFIDRAYNLAHNNGPMFNKGILYQDAKAQFKAILDVQRSGQIPELIEHGYTTLAKLHHASRPRPEIEAMVAKAISVYPKEFGQFVDWVKVEASGSTEKYPEYITWQAKTHPNTVPKAQKLVTVNIETTNEALKPKLNKKPVIKLPGKLVHKPAKGDTQTLSTGIDMVFDGIKWVPYPESVGSLEGKLAAYNNADLSLDFPTHYEVFPGQAAKINHRIFKGANTMKEMVML